MISFRGNIFIREELFKKLDLLRLQGQVVRGPVSRAGFEGVDADFLFIARGAVVKVAFLGLAEDAQPCLSKLVRVALKSPTMIQGLQMEWARLLRLDHKVFLFVALGLAYTKINLKWLVDMNCRGVLHKGMSFAFILEIGQGLLGYGRFGLVEDWGGFVTATDAMRSPLSDGSSSCLHFCCGCGARQNLR
ncbi:hypothetical protein V6N13_005058 [Hibiscus sabdariffa]